MKATDGGNVPSVIFSVQASRFALLYHSLNADAFMQRKSIGTLQKHGEQGALDFSKRWRESPGRPGPVSSGDVLRRERQPACECSGKRALGPCRW